VRAYACRGDAAGGGRLYIRAGEGMHKPLRDNACDECRRRTGDVNACVAFPPGGN
jgi:hypothetical protein